MSSKEFKWIGIVIFSIILMVILLQAYTIRENYIQSKHTFISKVQNSLDNSLEQYYAEIAKSDMLTFTDYREININVENVQSVQKGDSNIFHNQFFQRFVDSKLVQEEIRQLDSPSNQRDTVIMSYRKIFDEDKDSILIVDKYQDIVISKGKIAADSISGIKELANKIVISISRDTLDFPKLDSLFSIEIGRQSMPINYVIEHYRKDSLIGSFATTLDSIGFLTTTSNSTFLPSNQKVKLKFENATLTILKLGIIEFLSSLFFTVIIVVVLLYLYRIIQSQKTLSEIKNDLINNITHEFKTPIATVSTALEALQNFNPQNDPQKTSRYLAISKQQLNKLHLMVEKLLETASLDKQHIALEKETIQIDELLIEIVEKFKSISMEKKINLHIPKSLSQIIGDTFHLENAISNIIDNAIKYGGDTIQIHLKQDKNTTIIIQDNGGHIPKEHKSKIFDQFYRIPQGNVHDVKGFGIGLYYVQKIINQHEGQIELETSTSLTSFKITLP